VADNLTGLLGDERDRKRTGLTQGFNDEVFRLMTVGMGFKRLARNFANSIFVTGAFRPDSCVHSSYVHRVERELKGLT